ncbi:hypothetical protein [Marivirga sp.]|uniref:hypothetical protein n=1 Tax=Marivirga sp. TaxID=2018662 RepID=UPI002D7FC22B|nr:hypothetical protein [Marivirga sp.]HET8861168.1 hypothetical protein [Marivirga sp.]
MKAIFLICFSSFLFLNCTSEEIHQDRIELKFNLINQEGIITTEFKNSTQPIFNLQIINNSNDDTYLVSHNLSDENIFKVFSTTELNENSEPLSFGKPFKNAGCEFIGGYPINSDETFYVTLPWIPKEGESENYPSILCNYNFDNDSLTQGIYTTSLDLQFSFQSNGNTISKSIQKEINFSIN